MNQNQFMMLVSMNLLAIISIFAQPFINDYLTERRCVEQANNSQWYTELDNETSNEYKSKLLSICFDLGNLDAARAMLTAANNDDFWVLRRLDSIEDTLDDVWKSVKPR